MLVTMLPRIPFWMGCTASVAVFDPILSNLFNIQEILGVPSEILLYLPNNKSSQNHQDPLGNAYQPR